MYIYRCAGSISCVIYDNENHLLVSDFDDLRMAFNDGFLRYVGYSCGGNKRYNKIFFEGSEYAVNVKGVVCYQGVVNGDIYLQDENGCRLSLPHELIFSYVVSALFKKGSMQIVTALSDYPNVGDKSVLSCDLLKGIFFTRNIGLRSPVLFDSSVYGWNRRDKKFLKFNFQLETEWSWPFPYREYLHTSGSVRSWTPVEYKDSVFLYLGHIHDENIEVNGERVRQFKRGLLYCFNQETGAVKWHREFEFAVEDTLLNGDCLFVATSNCIEVLNPENGETVKTVDTGLVTGFSRGAGGEVASLHIDGSYLYYCYRKETCLLVFDVATLALRYRLDLPDGWCARRFQFKDENTGRLYFDLLLGPKGAPEYHRNAVLELHPDELGQPVTLEPSPETHISLKPSADEPGKEEVWVEIRCPVIDDALRFGELHTQNQAYIQGHTLVAYHCEPNPKFNGVVHFRYSGCELPAADVREKLKIMEQRFEKWNDSASVYAGDSSRRLCRLDAQYSE